MTKLQLLKKLSVKKSQIRNEYVSDKLCQQHPNVAKAIADTVIEILDWFEELVLDTDEE